jgi:hypothetical protein
MRVNSYFKTAQFTNHTKNSDGETLARRRMIERLLHDLKRFPGELAWRAVHDRMRRSYSLSRVDRVRKIRDIKQRTDIGKYSFVNRTIENWNQLPAEALGSFPCKPKIFRS